MNNIGNITQKYEQQTFLSETTEKRRIESPETRQTEAPPEVARDDKVSLSQTSREMQLAKTAVAETTEVREEKVAQIKQAIANDQYKMDTGKMADNLIGSIISEII